jgi:DNA-binding transcriptional regulator YhcF (GntR family)
MQGYIKDYRKELDSAIWMMPPLYHRIWQYLKYMVNHQENKIPMKDGTFLTIKPGQHLTSVREIAKNVGWYEGVKWKEPNPKTVSTILDWLEKQSMIKIDRGKGNKQYTLITLINWDLYQLNDVEGNSKVTDREHLADINNNDKECIKNDIYAAADNMRVPEESDGVPTTGPLGDSANAGEISHTSEEAVKVLIDRFIQLRAYGFSSSPADETAAREILSAGVPLEKALVWLKERFDTYKPKHTRDRINSLSYCAGYILDKHFESLQKEKEGNHGAKIRQYRTGNDRSAKQNVESITGGRVGRIRTKKA